MQAHLVTAPGDGVAPAVLLSLPAANAAASAAGGGPPPAQYLFNVPEGFSRLVLEHRLRPGAGLRAAFACDAASLAGFGGLVMRLRGEGHGQLHVVGPSGTQAAVCSLRHFIHWRHPAVVLEEDDRIEVAALWKPPLVAAMWPSPTWLQGAQPPEGASQPVAGKQARSSSEESSSEESSSSEENSSSSEESGSSSKESSGSGDSDSSSADSGMKSPPPQQPQGQAGCGSSLFDSLDTLFMRGGGGKRQALDRLKQAAAGPAGSSPALPAASLAAATGSVQRNGGTAAAVAAAAAAAAPAPSRRRQPVAAAAEAGEADDVAVIGGKRFQQLPAKAGINVWVCQKLATKGSAAGGAAATAPAGRQQAQQQQQQQEQQQLLGFVCHLKATDQLLLLTNLHSRAAVTQLQQHPAVQLLLKQHARVAAVLHLAAPGVAGSRVLRQLCQQLRPAVAASGGQQLVLEQPGAHGSNQIIGHLAAARTTAKLNLVSSRIFPLPAGVRQPPPVSAAATAAEPAGGPSAEPATALPTSPEPKGCDGRVEGEPRPQGQPEPTAAASSGGTGDGKPKPESTSSGPVHVRHLSVLAWQAAEAAQQGVSAAPPRVVLAPTEGFADVGVAGFDAGAVQHEVLQERPQLVAQLEQLRGQQQKEELPGEAQLQPAGMPVWQCRQNVVAPPPPPGTAAATAGPWPGWQQPGGHLWQQQQPPGGQPWQSAQQQQQQQQRLGSHPWQPIQQTAQQPQQEPRVMRPMYQHQPPAQHPGYYQQPQWQPPSVQQQWQSPGALQLRWLPPCAFQPPPPPGSPPVLQPQVPLAQVEEGQEAGSDNKRAADGLKARLQGGKRHRLGAATDRVTVEAAGAGAGEVLPQPPQEQEQQQPPCGEAQQSTPWLAGAPAAICRLAAIDRASAAAGGPEVLFLGTGSAEPSKYRAASAIQLRLSCGQSLLLDCGEGALGALCRSYGTAAALRQVAALGCLWVSHRHADHMSGVLSLLAVYPASLPPLLVVGPRSLQDWLAEAATPLRLGNRYRFVHCAELNQPGHWARQALRQHLGLVHIECVPVRHCSDAYGLVLRHEEGWSVVYSGDTQPCQQLVQAGQGCTLLVHEATFEPCLEQQARQKRHSTTAEALEVAQRMGAYRCILTHFSQRYPKWPEGLAQPGQAARGAADPTDPTAQQAAGPGAGPAAGATAAVAFDGMRVPLVLLPVLPTLMPAVQAALADAEEEEEQEQEEEQQEAAGQDGEEAAVVSAVA